MNVSILKHYINHQANENNGTSEENAVVDIEKQVSTSDAPKIKRKKVVSKPQLNRAVPRPLLRFSDLGGMKNLLLHLRPLIERPLLYPQVFEHLGIEPPRGILLCGPSGCGKTFLANAIAGEYGLPFIRVASTELVSNMSGDTELKIREIFEEAKSLAPSIIFIDDIDAIITKKDNAQREMEKRISSQLIASLDDLTLYPTLGKNVLVIAATSRPETLEPSLRRAGRFDHEIKINIPNEDERLEIFEIMMRKIVLSPDVDKQYIARHSPGYVGADLKMLITEAAMGAVNRVCHDISSEKMAIEDSDLTEYQKIELTEAQLASVKITMNDFQVALGKVQPAAKREGFAVVPDVSWDDIGALGSVRQVLRMAVVEPLCHPELFQQLGIDSPAGILLWGPPGCGKTLLAKAVANESHSNFISVKGPELLNKYVGESEKAVRQVFERARLSSPCVIFFDELDALCPKRSDDTRGYASRVVNQLLTEMDGLEGRKSVYIIGATNRPDIIDPAVLRPGRLDKLVYIDLPNDEERWDILVHQTKKTPLAVDVDLHEISKHQRCEGFSGADLTSLVREASLIAAKEYLSVATTSQGPIEAPSVSRDHFLHALNSMFPSVSAVDRSNYEQLHREFTTQRLK